MIQTELISFLSPQIHFSFHTGLGHGVTSSLLLKSRTEDHSWLRSLHQACHSNLLNTIPAAPSLHLSPITLTSFGDTCTNLLTRPLSSDPLSIQWWPGSPFSNAGLAVSLPLPISLPRFPLLSVPHLLTLTPCKLLPSGQGQSSHGPFPSLHHTPVTLNALWFWNKPLSLASSTSHDLSAPPPPPRLEYPPSASHLTESILPPLGGLP